jgi:hypothetical protein
MTLVILDVRLVGFLHPRARSRPHWAFLLVSGDLRPLFIIIEVFITLDVSS